MLDIRVALSNNIRAKSVTLLNRHLAACIDLYAQMKQAHWTVRGPGFIAIHELFDRAATEVAQYADILAERTGALGGVAEGTVQTAARVSFLKPYGLRIADCQAHVEAASAALAAFGSSVREGIDQAAEFGDAGTSDVFTEISRKVDQLVWLVESNLDSASNASGHLR